MNYKILFFSSLCVFLFFYSILSVVISDIRDDIPSKKPMDAQSNMITAEKTLEIGRASCRERV